MNLHPYQRVAVDHLQRNPRAALFLDMGLGKTATVLSALTPEHLPVLVTAPKRVAEYVWPEEARTWRPDLRLVVATGSPAKREEALTSGADVVVVGRDNLRSAVTHTGQYRTVVLDELSGFKSRASQRWKAAKYLTHQRWYVWGLTGTPAPNGLIDLWAQMYLLDGGKRLGSTLTAYRSRYFSPGRQLPNGVITEWILRKEAEPHIHALLADLCLSMDAAGRLEVPAVTFNTVTVPLPPSTLRVYHRMKTQLVADLREVGGERFYTAANAAVLTNRLSQISAGFLYSDPDDHAPGRHEVLHREKVDAVREIVEGTGGPVLVFYRYRAEKQMLLAALGDQAHTIDEPDAVARWNRGELPVLLAHPASAGHGLNLQHGGHTIVWTTLPWSLEEWEQANARLVRQGQAHPVVIHTLQSPGTIDPVIQERLLLKTHLQDRLLAHLESPL